jgi:hypothetical protein
MGRYIDAGSWSETVIIGMAVGLVVGSIAIAVDTAFPPDPPPSTRAPFFHVLAFDRLEKAGAFGYVEVMLFKDAVGNCYLTVGNNGQVTLAPESSCAAAEKVEQ